MRNLSLNELLEHVEAKIEVTEVNTNEMAIIGMALKFPTASDVRQYWNNLKAGRDSVTTMPSSRKRDAQAYVQRCLRQDFLDAQYEEIGYLDEIDTFDYEFFGLSPKEASLMDPGHKLFLQCAWQAVEDAGFGDGRLSGTDTGVFLGYSASDLYDYKRLIGELEPDAANLAAAGNIISMMASRVAYWMDLNGPSMMIDTACSSSLVALHEACKSIRSGDCSMAIVGGIRLSLVPVRRKEKLGIESSDGRTRTFDEYSDGSTLSEGVGAVVIKPLSSALKDGDTVYAVVKGSAVNQDGRSNGITAPNPDAHAAVIEKAWKAAGVHPETISYIEAHGTGTKLGDPVEMEGLMKAFSRYTNKKQFCAIGSAKSNLGHLDSAAGMAGLIKAALALSHRELPPSIYFHRPNRKIRFHLSPFYVNAKLRRWDTARTPRRCGVSSFGISGTNAHVVLEESPMNTVHPVEADRGAQAETTDELRLFTVSAKSVHSLLKLVDRHLEWLGEVADAEFADYCRTSCVGRGHYKFRLAIAAGRMTELIERLRLAKSTLHGELIGDRDVRWNVQTMQTALAAQDVFVGADLLAEIAAGSRTLADNSTECHAGKVPGDRSADEAASMAESEFRAKGASEARLTAVRYAAGGEIEWDAMYPSARRNKARLPVYPFQRKRCWLDVADRELYRPYFSTEAELYVPEWKRVEADPELEATKLKVSLQEQACTLLFTDRGGVAKRYAQSKESIGESAVIVAIGERFAQIDDRTFEVGPSAADYAQLVEAIRQLGITDIVHFASIDAAGSAACGAGADTSCFEGDQHKENRHSGGGIYSLFRFVTALRLNGWKSPLQVKIVAPNAYRVTEDQSEVRPEHAAMFGYGKVIQYELPGSQCRCIDWNGTASEQQLFEELGRTTNEYVIALRGEARYLERISRRSEKRTDEGVSILSGGTYIVTGGVGIVGLQLSLELASKANVTIVLLNRSAFPARHEWKRIRYNYEMNRENELLYKRIVLMEQIIAAGSEVVCMQADIADEASLSEALASIRGQYGQIHGIVHAAGVMRGFEEVQKAPTFEELCEDLRPKMDGTLLLDRLTEDDPIDFFLLCSSVMTLTGGSNVGGYVAANAFLDSFAEERSARGKRTVAINWSTWEETFYASVVSLDNPEYVRNYGQYTLFKVMTNEHAAAYLAEALASNRSRLIVGQANKDGAIFQLLDTFAFRFDPHTLEQLMNSRIVPDPGAALYGLAAAASTATEAVESELTGRAEPNSYTSTERRIGGIWSSVLGYRQLNVKDNFYELGGDSISMMKVISGISQQFSYDIKPTEFMERLTIESLAGWLDERQQDAKPGSQAPIFPQAVPEPDKLGEPFGLTEVQRAYFIGRNDYFELGGVSTHAYSELETKLDMERLSAALNVVIRRHPMLRCVIMPDGKQRILERTPEYRIETTDIRRQDEAARQERIERERKRMSHDVFRTDRWPLFEIKAFRMTDDTHYLCIGFDVLIADGLSMQIIERDVMHAYHHPEDELPPLDCSFRDYMQAYESFRHSEVYEESKSYWLGKLDSFPEPPSIPLRCDPRRVAKPTFNRLTESLTTAEWQTVKRLAAHNRVTPSAVFCTIYADILSRWSNQRQLAVNLTVFNRYPFHPDIPELVGDFTSLMLLGLDFKSTDAFWNKTRLVNRTIAEALEHRHFDGVEMIREIARSRQKQNAAVMPYVFTSLLSQDFQGTAQIEQPPGDVKMRISQTSQAYLDFQLTERGGVPEISWDYVTELFEEDMIRSMFDAFLRSVARLTEEVEPGQLPLPEQEQLLYASFNATAIPMDGEMTLDRMFARQAHLNPSRIAAVAGDRQIDYGGVLELSQRYAAFLLDHGVARGDLIGVMGNRSVETGALLLAVLSVGAAYVPIDPDYPEERRSYIIRHSGCTMLLDAHVLQEDEAFPSAARVIHQPAEPASRPDDLAYVIYTSGSTGTPKGVAVTHKAAANTIADINAKFGISEHDRIAAVSSLCFDLSVYDWFGAWAAGAAVIIIDDPRDMPAVLRTSSSCGVTVWNTVPALMGALLEHSTLQGAVLPPLRIIMLSGDWIPLPLARSVLSRFPDASFMSLGGATEAAIWSIYYPVASVHEEWKSVPYGMPLANQSWYVLDESANLCPVGVAGELHIGGVGLASCYWKDEKKTAQAFVQHPTFGRLYRTGDFGVMRRDGFIEFLGRRDTQIKIRGYRVELGEIENCLLRWNAVKEAVVVNFKDKAGQTYLAAYVVAEAGGETLNKEALIAYLEEQLPSYMIPSRYTFMDRIPLSPNGKLDRKALPEPQEEIRSADTHGKAKSEMEHLVLGMWNLALDRDDVGTKEHFFDIGGDSIRLMNVHAQLEAHYPGKASITDLFAYPTVESFAGLMERRLQPVEYVRTSSFLNEATALALSLLAERSGVETYAVCSLAFVYLIADAVGESEISLAAADRSGLVQAQSLQLDQITSVSQFIAELQYKRLDASSYIAAEAPYGRMGRRPLAFALDFDAAVASMDAGTGVDAVATIYISDDKQIHVMYRQQENDDSVEAAQMLLANYGRLLHILAEQR
ncbi:amino acid adenylation domain-containing protein [Paenibacillus cellulosilyticus]|uniref:Amino acid adenylation domain-containing protein n=1 Tax=Paenibacillus cellulosilyticus TaxID=375489 RepID=A0A2V2YUL0_9BACL|nr:non-ribosomal peptide synthetase [Paenibacillus cellulosilyticus]PWW04851.1 amino acid adenylation domain-containing protein [Paenibacillus cellulosilyticus]QKS45964.1 amino acid adenylation domain-containing protein [Paenibacillus cellulosilyticus]